MNAETRKVVIFVIIGLSAAALLAVAVWRTGTPTSTTADTMADGRTTSSVSPTGSSTSQEPNTDDAAETDDSPGSALDDAPTSGGTESFAAPEEDDPFLAPNAIAAAPSAVAPTSVHRPANVGEQPRSFASEPTQAPGGATPADSTLATGDGSAPAEETASSAPGQPTQPGATATSTTPAEPAERPTLPVPGDIRPEDIVSSITAEPDASPTPQSGTDREPEPQPRPATPDTETDTDTAPQEPPTQQPRPPEAPEPSPAPQPAPAPQPDTRQQGVPSGSGFELSGWPWQWNLFEGSR